MIVIHTHTHTHLAVHVHVHSEEGVYDEYTPLCVWELLGEPCTCHLSVGELLYVATVCVICTCKYIHGVSIFMVGASKPYNVTDTELYP